MQAVRHATAWLIVSVLCAAMLPAAWAQDEPPVSAKTWMDRTAEFEEFLRGAEVIQVKEIGTGVTKPRRADLAPGGLAEAFAWKDKQPGICRGYFESYQAEIAAYELDKLLQLGMTPPTVERRVDGDLGAAVLWAGPTQSWKEMGGVPTPPSIQFARWNYQLVCAKMFHNLIGNKDPNLGNWLVDPAWNLILIDNSRALTSDKSMPHKLTRVDRDLWDRMLALDEATLTATVGEWLGDREIRAILERRDEMKKDIAELVEDRGEHATFVRFRPPPAAPTQEPQASVVPANAASDTLAGQLVDALNETPVVFEGSEPSWIGTVVRLVDYDGPDLAAARDGLDAGHTYGLATAVEGLICMTRDRWDPEPYEALRDLVGDEAEVFGITQAVDGMTEVGVTLSRAR